jgi:hypothetical protein
LPSILSVATVGPNECLGCTAIILSSSSKNICQG